MFVIKVTNFQNDVLYVCATPQRSNLGFHVKIRKFAKKFATREIAENAIKTFNPSHPKTTFAVVEA